MKAGRKWSYDSKRLPELIDSVTKAMGSLGQVADLNDISRATFYEWMNKGEEDRKMGIDSEFAQLTGNIKRVQAEVVIDLCDKAMKNVNKSRFIMWFLSKICREDFGAEGMEIKELRDLFKAILPLLNGKGDARNDSDNGKKEGQAG